MKILFRTATLDNLEEILAFEKEALKAEIEDEMERELHSWNARWRRESLEHYLKLGWSVVVRDESNTLNHKEGELLGYLLSQPFLFFEGQTQTLWVEQMSYTNNEIRDILVDTAYKMAREKHLQRLLFSQSSRFGGEDLHPKAAAWDVDITAIPTTKG